MKKGLAQGNHEIFMIQKGEKLLLQLIEKKTYLKILLNDVIEMQNTKNK